ncbi:hypothetical protein J4466_02360 [Candidatus Pacearchaeota archaeon]|nr:hypothetical protein [Candidatus Pacearchaeota archaeon]
MLFKNKKGSDSLYEIIMFIVLNLLFFGAMFAFVARSGTNAGLYEQVYSKQIALLIDSAKPGMVISINLNEMKSFIEENKLSLDQIINLQNGKVIVKLTQGSKGYIFDYFSNYEVVKGFEQENDNLILKLSINKKGAGDG